MSIVEQIERKKVEERYNLISRRRELYKKRDIILAFWTLGFYFSILPIIPFYIYSLLKLKNDWYILLFWIAFSVFFFIPMNKAKKNIPDIPHTERAFYNLQNMSEKIKTIAPEDEKVPSRYYFLLNQELDLLEEIVNDTSIIPFLSNETQVEHTKTLIIDIKEKVIPLMEKGENLKEISEIFYHLSLLFVDVDYNRHRNDCQVIIDEFEKREKEKKRKFNVKDNVIIRWLGYAACFFFVVGVPAYLILYYLLNIQYEMAVIGGLAMMGTSLSILSGHINKPKSTKD